MTMRAATIRSFGDPDVFAIEHVPVPEPDDDEVLIRLSGAGVGSWDIQIRSGAWGPQGAFPLILGTDGAGTIVRAGHASGFRAGERVWTYVYGAKKGGCYAEYVCAPSSCVGRVPPDIALSEASSAATVAITAYCGIREILDVRAADVVLVHGATGGLGLSATQLSAWSGASVMATARHHANRLRTFGAHAAFDLRDPEAHSALRDHIADVTKVLLAAPFEDAETGGLIPLDARIAYPNGVDPPAWRSDALAYDGVPTRERFDALANDMTGRGFRLPVAREFSLDDVGAAHETAARGGFLGKVGLALS